MPLDQHDSYDPSDTKLTIYPNASLTCSGELIGWRFKAQTNGVFWASVWEYNGNDTYKLMGTSRIQVRINSLFIISTEPTN